MFRFLILAVVSSTASAANLIVNGSFEIPVTTTPNTLQSFPTIPGWTPAGSATSIYVINGDIGVFDWPSSGQLGQQFADIGNASSTGIQQTISVPSGFFNPTLTWYDATLGITPGSVIEFSSYSVTVADSLSGMVATSTYATNSDAWAVKSLALPSFLAPGNYTLTFEPSSGVGQKDTLIDNVVLVPEPSSITLLLLAALPLLTCRSRRSS